ncbi:MAG: GTP-binding protein, partial [Deltaproteobacteria bacterium]|nr:GTP-binding protein [Deltaproteobacteria bacterium]
MLTQSTRKGLRLHIGIFGRRNVGKSSLLNAITRQQVAIVSELAGTTTDPVEKPMELLPLGPVLFIDTAGIDDTGALGELRIKKTHSIFNRTDLGIIVTEAESYGDFETKLIHELNERKIPLVIVFNKADLNAPESKHRELLLQQNIPCVSTVAVTNQGILDLRQALLDAVPPEML